MKVLIFITLGLVWKAQLATATIGTCGKEENKTYYIYNSHVNTYIYHCHETTESCEVLGVGKTVSNYIFAIKCVEILYGPTSPAYIYPTHYGYYNSYIKKSFIVCRNEATIMIKQDTFNIISIIADKYPVLAKFWIPYHSCNLLEYISTRTWSQRKIHSKKYITSSSHNYIVAMALEQQISLCERSFWITNIPGILASDEYIERLTKASSKLDQYQNVFQKVHATVQSKCELEIRTENRAGTAADDKGVGTSTVKIPKSDCIDFQCDDATKFPLEQESEIDTPCPEEVIAALRTQLYCITFVVIICVLWLCIGSAVDMYINFLTLQRAAKKLPNRSRMYIVNCVSQSLTNRWLFLNKNAGQDKKEIPLDVTRDAKNHNLYESID